MNNKIYLYLVVLIMFIPIGTAKDIIVHDNIITPSGALGGGNVTNNYYTSSVVASTCNPANEASYYNGTGFQCVSISDNDPYILLTSEGNLNVNSATYWAGLTTPSPDWNSNKSVPYQNLTGVPTDYPNSSIPGKLDVATYSGNYPNTTVNNYGGSFPNTTLINYLLINTYGVNFPNTSLQNYLLTSAYNGDFPNDSYKANDTTTLGNALLNDTTTLNSALSNDTATLASANSVSKANDTVTLITVNTNIVDTNTSMLNYVVSQLSGKMAIFTTWAGLASTDTGATQSYSLSLITSNRSDWDNQNRSIPVSNLTGSAVFNSSVPAANITGLGTSFAQYNHTRNNVTAASTTVYNLSMSLTLTKGMMEIIECDLLTNASLTTISPQFWINITGSDSQTQAAEFYTSPSVNLPNSSYAANFNVIPTTSAGTLITPFRIQSHSNQTAAGTFTIRMKASGTGTVQLDRGSYCSSVEQ